MIFTPAEREYLARQRLGRLATVRADGRPQNSPTGFEFNTALETIDIFGWNMTGSQKYRNIAATGWVSFVVDDVKSLDPWAVRGLEIRGRAEGTVDPAAAKAWRDRLAAAPYARVREFPADDDIIRIRPRRIISWGVEPDTVEVLARNV